jgi:hypothetical protein
MVRGMRRNRGIAEEWVEEWAEGSREGRREE